LELSTNICSIELVEDDREAYKPQIELFPKRDNQILHQNQYGFVPKSNTLSAYAGLIEYVKKSIDEIFLVCCLFVELSKDFNMINHGMFAHEIELMNAS
jgi:hypothetical protein